MDFRQQYKTRKKILLSAGTIVILGVLFLFVSSNAFPKNVSGIALARFIPLWKGENILKEKVVLFGSFLRSKKTLIQENQSLASRTQALEIRLLSGNIVLEENNELKELMGRSVSTPGLLATIVSKPNRSPYDTLLLDVGVEHGVAVGDKVFAHEEVVVGKIDEVYSGISRVKLFSSPGEEIEVAIGNEHVGAVAHGRGGGNFAVKLPRGVDVEEGDAISFPAISTEILGVVEKIHAEPADSFQTLFFKNPVNMNELHFVLVRKK